MSNDSSTDSKIADAEGSDDRTATARGAEWASRIMTIALGMVVPGLAGYWLDQRLGTQVILMLIGFALGGYLAAIQLMAIARQSRRKSRQSRRKSKPRGIDSNSDSFLSPEKDKQ